jgi:hypothetical protein
MVEPFTEASLRGRLARIAVFVRTKPDGTPVHVPPPLNVIRDVLALGEWHLPHLVGITEIPVFRADGSVLGVAGYDDKTGLFYAASPDFAMPSVPASPTREDIGNALAVIGEVLADFPFVDNASRANALAALLTPVLRPAIRGRTPLFLFDAPSPGTGKTTLAAVVASTTSEAAVGMFPEPEDDAEWRKRLTSAFCEGHAVLIMDDMKRQIASPALAMAVSAEVWRDRLLGTNRTVGISNRVILIATGNNLRVGGDLPRRCVWVRLDAKLAEPWRRTAFRHPDLMTWVRERRGELLWALLTLGHAWWASGCPEPRTAGFAGFQDWCRTVGGVLTHAGVSGFLGNFDRFYSEVDDGAPQFGRFLRAWHQVFGSAPVRVAQIVDHIKRDDSELCDALPETLAEFADEKSNGKLSHRLGNLLRRKVDVRHGKDCIRVERAGSSNHFQVGLWRVTSDEQPPCRDGAPSPASGTSAEPDRQTENWLAEAQGSGRREWVLAMGAGLGWPALAIGRGESLAAGESAWRAFCKRADDDQIARAIVALDALDARKVRLRDRAV